MTITVEQMREKLIPIGDLVDRLGTTEPLSTQDINNETPVRFRLQPGWETDLEATSDTAPVNAFITVAGQERQLTKEAALQATSQVGVPMALVKKTPGSLIEPILNHFWDSGLGGTEYKALSVGDTVSAFTKATITPFSNLELVERITSAVEKRYGASARVFADYKFSHTLQSTDVRLILPDIQETIRDSGMGDVPDSSEDIWLGGMHLHNSLVGKGQTTIEPYLFRWWCTNGCTTERRAGMVHSRLGNAGQDAEGAYAWAATAVDEVLGGMEAEFESVQALTSLSVAGNTADVLADIFGRYDLPVSQRDAIRENVENLTGPLTLYSIMQSITQVANDPNLDQRRADRLMRIGGAIPSTEFDPLKARIFREGQSNPSGPNPYEIQPL
jgi:hypothetical protein